MTRSISREWKRSGKAGRRVPLVPVRYAGLLGSTSPGIATTENGSPTESSSGPTSSPPELALPLANSSPHLPKALRDESKTGGHLTNSFHDAGIKYQRACPVSHVPGFIGLSLSEVIAEESNHFHPAGYRLTPGFDHKLQTKPIMTAVAISGGITFPELQYNIIQTIRK